MNSPANSLPSQGMRRVSTTAVMRAWLAIAAIRLITLQTGLDHLTTLAIWSNPICATVGGLSALLLALVFMRNWFNPPPDTPIPERNKKLRERSFFFWCVCGVVVSIGFAGLTAWMCASLVSVGAQYIRGSPDSFEATAISEKATISYKAACRLKLDILRTSDSASFTICIDAKYRPALANQTFAPQTAVTVHVLRTALGAVVQSVEPASR